MANQNQGLIDGLFKVGAHFGFSRSRRHATMKPFVYGTKNKTDLMDLTKTAPLFEAALQYVRGLGAHAKIVLIVGGKPEMSDLIRAAAGELQMPYVASRWLGGTLTNFPEIKKRIKKMAELLDERETGTLAKKYTKKERVLIDRDIARLEENFGGIAQMEKIPDALLVVDTRRESIAVEEARTLGIPVIGIMNSDCDATHATYPIIANDASRDSVKFVLNEIVEAYREGTKGNIS